MPKHHDTERLRLDPWRPEDLDAFHRIWGDPDVISWGPMEDAAASERLLRRVIGESHDYEHGFGWFAVVLRETHEICGNVFLQPYGYGAGWELGYHVVPSAQGQGIATEASRGLIDFALSEGAERVVALVMPDNAPSQRVCQKLGLQKTGDQMHAGLHHDVLEAVPG